MMNNLIWIVLWLLLSGVIACLLVSFTLWLAYPRSRRFWFVRFQNGIIGLGWFRIVYWKRQTFNRWEGKKVEIKFAANLNIRK